ncbi:hypothetical protein [Bacillus sp. FJAT-45350]|uniref:hypothetical protein n=1 Tax=Bacillus sp. FJAT-45350 TaxID=2011014 RepID=UPI000BB75531|nr:hypothetical protein [Bacillus sp. FJAT-45350]
MNKLLFTSLKSYFILGMCLLYIFDYFIPINAFYYGLAVFTFFVLVSSMFSVKIVPRVIGLTLVSLGILINYRSGNGLFSNLEGLLINLPILTLLLLVPLIAIPMKMSGYFQAASYYMDQWKKDSKKTYMGLSGFISLVGPILNLGSIRITHDMVESLKIKPAILAKAYLVGFSTTMLWSPYFASVALVLFYVDVRILDYMFIGLTLAIIQLIVGYLLFRSWEKKDKESFSAKEGPKVEKDGEVIYKTKLLKLASMLAFLILFLLFLEYITPLPMLLLVSLIAILFPIVWGLFTTQWGSLRVEFQQYKERLSGSMNNEIVLFLCAGLFGNALANSVFANSVEAFITSIASFSFLVFVLFVIGIISLFAFIGIHQIVVVPILAMQIDASVIGTSPLALALLFTLAWSMSSIISPLNATNMLVSGIVKRDGITIGLMWNGIYVCSMLVFGVVFILLLHSFY